MSRVLSRFLKAGVAALGFAAASAFAQTAICYNCPTEWADWGTQLRAIKAKTGITIPPDNKNSGQSLAQPSPRRRARSPTSPTSASPSRSRR